jgi:hypothetical protein
MLVHFSIWRIGVKRFSCPRFVRRQISFASPRFSSGSVLRPSHHGIRRTKRCNLTHVLVAEAIGTRAQSALTSSIVPQRTSIPPRRNFVASVVGDGAGHGAEIEPVLLGAPGARRLIGKLTEREGNRGLKLIIFRRS